MKVTGVILAGGASSRMGTDKAFVQFRSQYMIERALELMRPCCDELLISGPLQRLAHLGPEVVPDVFPNCGPLGGLHAALGRALHPTVLVVPCDMPNLNTDMLVRLLAASPGHDAVVPMHPSGKVQPLVAVYQQRLWTHLAQRLNERRLKMQDFLASMDVRYLPFDEAGFENINSREDLE